MVCCEQCQREIFSSRLFEHCALCLSMKLTVCVRVKRSCPTGVLAIVNNLIEIILQA